MFHLNNVNIHKYTLHNRYTLNFRSGQSPSGHGRFHRFVNLAKDQTKII